MNKVSWIKYNKTRIPEITYGKIKPSVWSFFHEFSKVGKEYASKAELLANCENYLKEFGY